MVAVMINELPSPADPKQHTLAALLSSPPVNVRCFVFSTLIRVIRKASLEALLEESGPFTVFAPSDGAFARMPNEAFDKLLDPGCEPWLITVITYHIVPGHWPVTSLLNRSVRAVNGERIKGRQNGAHLMVNNAKILASDIPARNGLVHEIDDVLMPAREEGTRKKKVVHL